MDRSIHEQVVEDLYTEALELADEARAVFDLRDEAGRDKAPDQLRIAMSIEGLRTTTRVMHILAWLLNQRAYHAGELTRLQLLRHGTLGEERLSDPDNMAILELPTRALIRDTERLHARVKRLDEELRHIEHRSSDPVRSMQGRIAQAFAGR
ncbi:DUF1465 family protein [Qipengyuania sphaerica]|uniref:DUF1465 family protein n=1 Tax=Qipengyuania sphaerica TaxID=2867243 RepID=UPI001FFCC9DA|nr:DUF1465 family protein [Qipengyuania sphaerica]